MASFAAARRMMIEGQLRTNDVTEPRLLAAVAEVPRERFVPAHKRALAYLDRDLPVGGGEGQPTRYLLKPLVLAKLIDIAGVIPSDRVLDVGCATGYSSAVLSHLAGQVVALEEDGALAERARAILRELEIANVTVKTGPLHEGAAAEGPFDIILINGAVEMAPNALGAQLRDGGRLVCVLRRGPVGNGMIYRASAGVLSGRSIFGAAAPILPGFVTPPAFVF